MEYDPATHVYVQLANLLRVLVGNGDFRGKVPGIRELAREYSVNLKTANKAIDILVEDGLLHRVRGKGTFVVDHGHKSAPLYCGLILPNISNPYFAQFAQTLGEKGIDNNVSFLVNATGGRPERLVHVIEMYRQRGIRLAVVQGGVVRDSRSVQLLLNSGLALVGFHTRLDQIDDVWPDMRAGAQLATDHLLSAYEGEVAFVSGSDEAIESTGRFHGYRDSLLSHGLTPRHDMLLTASPTHRGGYLAAMQLLRLHPRPRNIVFYNQIMALGGISALRSRGCQVPDDVAVVGFDDSLGVDEMIVPTTAVSFPFDVATKHLVTLIRRRVENPKIRPLSIRLSPELIVRDSSRSIYVTSTLAGKASSSS
jgi:amidase